MLESERWCLVFVVQEYPSFFKPNTNGNVFQHLKNLSPKFPFHKSLDILFQVLIATLTITFIFFRLEKQMRELRFPCFVYQSKMQYLKFIWLMNFWFLSTIFLVIFLVKELMCPRMYFVFSSVLGYIRRNLVFCNQENNDWKPSMTQ